MAWVQGLDLVFLIHKIPGLEYGKRCSTPRLHFPVTSETLLLECSIGAIPSLKARYSYLLLGKGNL